ncbi:amino acid ABC transporter substrate-binding protein [Skermanella stibiiresistens SB22]|uniref:Amino acid ABC transporter substrate-binding protein n=1 Tax=Skermanella stibiiresistens SB22 TaxID=1385369 RepID=W9H6W3_9PROT|nr:amino acid ABC transporter substrate-binding protein [Skermanella stibiiresistens]EWY41769.1 amino acid ABC transporter substrate-binding protein [Skermanella stibiiresistens SB22]
MKTKIIAAIGTALAIAFGGGAASAGPTLNAVKQKGFVQCGVNTGLPGFSNPDSQGNWTGLDVDVCRAVAAAIFGDAKAVRFTPLSAQQRFTALQSGEIDILSRNTTWTLTRDTSLGLNFAPTTFYDGQGFMVPKALGVKSATELNGATVCVQPGTTTELNLADYFRAKGMQFNPVVIESFDEVNAAFFAGRCDVYTTDASGMASIRSTLAANPDDYIILPELISKEPLGPAVRHGDDEFFDIVKWAVYASIEAEEKGISSANVDEMVKSQDPTVQRLLGSNPGMGQALGLDEKWAYNIVKLVGNYGEIFERNVGVKTSLKLERGPNGLWTNGGLMYAPPIR